MPPRLRVRVFGGFEFSEEDCPLARPLSHATGSRRSGNTLAGHTRATRTRFESRTACPNDLIVFARQNTQRRETPLASLPNYNPCRTRITHIAGHGHRAARPRPAALGTLRHTARRPWRRTDPSCGHRHIPLFLELEQVQHVELALRGFLHQCFTRLINPRRCEPRGLEGEAWQASRAADSRHHPRRSFLEPAQRSGEIVSSSWRRCLGPTGCGSVLRDGTTDGCPGTAYPSAEGGKDRASPRGVREALVQHITLFKREMPGTNERPAGHKLLDASQRPPYQKD